MCFSREVGSQQANQVTRHPRLTRLSLTGDQQGNELNLQLGVSARPRAHVTRSLCSCSFPRLVAWVHSGGMLFWDGKRKRNLPYPCYRLPSAFWRSAPFLEAWEVRLSRRKLQNPKTQPNRLVRLPPPETLAVRFPSSHCHRTVELGSFGTSSACWSTFLSPRTASVRPGDRGRYTDRAPSSCSASRHCSLRGTRARPIPRTPIAQRNQDRRSYRYLWTRSLVGRVLQQDEPAMRRPRQFLLAMRERRTGRPLSTRNARRLPAS